MGTSNKVKFNRIFNHLNYLIMSLQDMRIDLKDSLEKKVIEDCYWDMISIRDDIKSVTRHYENL